MIGSDLLVSQLDALDLRYVALNPGATLSGMHETHLQSGATQAITCLHEGVAVSLAHGYAKARGAPMGVGLHDTVGILNGALGVFNAWADAVPMLILGGVGPLDGTERRPWIDWIHTVTDTPRPIRDMLVWAETPASLPAALLSLRRGHQRARSYLPGPAYVGLDTMLQQSEVAPDAHSIGPALPPWSPGPEDAVACRTAAGSPEECVDHLRTYQRLGFDEVTLRVTAADQIGQLRRVMSEVIPNL